MGSQEMAPTGRQFAQHERKLLLAQTGLGPKVLERLEAVGFRSLAQLRAAGADQVVQQVCEAGGGVGWANRRQALARALRAAAQEPQHGA